MTEFGTPPGEVSRQQLLATAEQLFGGSEFLRVTATISNKLHVDHLWTLEPKDLEHRVPPEVESAVHAEIRRTADINSEKSAELTEEWNNRSVVAAIRDWRAKRYLHDAQDAARRKPNISAIQHATRTASTYCQVENGWPTMDISVRQSAYEGELRVADQNFVLDPSASALSVAITYPEPEGRRYSVRFVHASFPYVDGIITTEEREEYAGNYWPGMPHVPFTDEPAHPSVYMQRAMEILIGQPDKVTY